MEWKVRKVGDKIQVKPVVKKGQKVWGKVVKDIDWQRKNGYGFVGAFLNWWTYTSVEEGDVILVVNKDSDVEPEAIVFKIEDGQIVEKGRFGYRSAFDQLRRYIAELLGSSIVEVQEETVEPESSGEKLIVEFDVERTVGHRYGYSEKFLKFRGEKVPYKAILKDGKFVAIVKRRYVLVENEFVEEVVKNIAEGQNWNVEVINEFPRIHVIVDKGNGIKAVVNNSVDGSLALRVDLMMQVADDTYTVFRLKEVAQVYRRHVGEIHEFVRKLGEVLDNVFKSAEKYKAFIGKLDEVEIPGVDELVETLVRETVGKTYEGRVVFGIRGGRIKTYGDLYRELAKLIWLKNNIQFKTKIEKFDKLNKYMALAVDIELD